METNEENITPEEIESKAEFIRDTMREDGIVTEAEELVAEESVCPECEGTGEVNEYTFDNDSKEWILDGTKPCICQIVEPFEE